MMGTGQLEVLPWIDAYVRDHRFGQGAILVYLVSGDLSRPQASAQGFLGAILEGMES